MQSVYGIPTCDLGLWVKGLGLRNFKPLSPKLAHDLLRATRKPPRAIGAKRTINMLSMAIGGTLYSNPRRNLGP